MHGEQLRLTALDDLFAAQHLDVQAVLATLDIVQLQGGGSAGGSLRNAVEHETQAVAGP